MLGIFEKPSKTTVDSVTSFKETFKKLFVDMCEQMLSDNFSEEEIREVLKDVVSETGKELPQLWRNAIQTVINDRGKTGFSK